MGIRAKTLLPTKTTIIVGDATKVKYKHRFDRIIVTAEFLNEAHIKKFVNEHASTFAICIFPFDGWLWKIVKCDKKLYQEKVMRVKFVPVLEGIL